MLADVGGEIAFHGTRVEFPFLDWAHSATGANAHGPGMYFTSDIADALTYALPSGWIREVQIGHRRWLEASTHEDIENLGRGRPEGSSLPSPRSFPNLGDWYAEAWRASRASPFGRKEFLEAALSLRKLGFGGRRIQLGAGIVHHVIFDEGCVRPVTVWRAGQSIPRKMTRPRIREDLATNVPTISLEACPSDCGKRNRGRAEAPAIGGGTTPSLRRPQAQ